MLRKVRSERERKGWRKEKKGTVKGKGDNMKKRRKTWRRIWREKDGKKKKREARRRKRRDELGEVRHHGRKI